MEALCPCMPSQTSHFAQRATQPPPLHGTPTSSTPHWRWQHPLELAAPLRQKGLALHDRVHLRQQAILRRAQRWQPRRVLLIAIHLLRQDWDAGRISRRISLSRPLHGPCLPVLSHSRPRQARNGRTLACQTRTGPVIHCSSCVPSLRAVTPCLMRRIPLLQYGSRPTETAPLASWHPVRQPRAAARPARAQLVRPARILAVRRVPLLFRSQGRACFARRVLVMVRQGMAKQQESLRCRDHRHRCPVTAHYLPRPV